MKSRPKSRVRKVELELRVPFRFEIEKGERGEDAAVKSEPSRIL